MKHSAIAWVLLLAPLALAVIGCEPYRIEHHHRPSFYQSASAERLPDELVRPDGTVIIYGDIRRRRGSEPAGGEMFEIRVEDDDGTVTLRNIFPDHVIGNAMMCIRGREWELMWRQLVSERSRATYAAEGKSFRDFAEFMEAQREPLMEMLNRMSFGYAGPDVVLERLGGGAMRVRLGPRIAEQFKYTTVDMVPEGGGLRLFAFR